ncbi:TolC family protein [Burkholderia cepacia]|uniref:TolC family protein n=1 Tax=Burkholderia cepacia TaxID=292 RepID=UPI002FE34B78
MSKRFAKCGFVLLLAGVSVARAQGFDPYRARTLVAATPAAPLLKDASCRNTPDNRPLEFDDVIMSAICSNPQARESWAHARAQTAALGVADAAYWPTLTAKIGVERDALSTTYGTSLGAIEQSQHASSKYGVLDLSWVLFDFGKRDAARREARSLLIAANAAQDNTLQTVFFNAAQAFYALRDAQALLDAAQRTESIVRESLVEASAKHDAGAGTLADKLQARTSYRRAVLERSSAEGDVRVATGALAVAMGLDANVPIRIAVQTRETKVPAGFDASIDQLIDEAKQRQPKLVAARAKLDAARADVDAVRAQSRPTISLFGSLTQNNPSYQQQPESIPVIRSRGSTIGMQVTIPLFEGFSSGYRIEQAQAQVDAQEAVVRDTELQVSFDVWKNYQNLQADTANLDNSYELLSDAQNSLEIARGRYRAGVGTFTDLLTVQAALADARKRRALAVSAWYTARLKLAESLGKLGVWRESE